MRLKSPNEVKEMEKAAKQEHYKLILQIFDWMNWPAAGKRESNLNLVKISFNNSMSAIKLVKPWYLGFCGVTHSTTSTLPYRY